MLHFIYFKNYLQIYKFLWIIWLCPERRIRERQKNTQPCRFSQKIIVKVACHNTSPGREHFWSQDQQWKTYILHKEFGPLCKACNLEEEMDRNGSSPPLPRALNPTWKTLRFSHMKFNGPWAYLAALSFFEVDRRKQVEWIFNHTIRTKTFSYS